MSLTPAPTEKEKKQELAKEGGILDQLKDVLANTKLDEKRKRTAFNRLLDKFANNPENLLTSEQAGESQYLQRFTTVDTLKDLIKEELQTKLQHEESDLSAALNDILKTE